MVSDNKKSKFATKKWYVIDNESKGKYSHHDPIKFFIKSIESGSCDSSDPYILVTGNIALGTITQVAFKNCAPFLLMKQVSLILEWLCII